MSQASAETTGTVDRLKELLFDTESRALDEIARRLDDLARSEPARRAELEAALKAEVVRVAGVHEAELRALSEKLEGVFARAGTDEGLRASVAEVLDGAIHAAEQERHQELSAAMAPLVVRTIKTEIRNSQDELVEAPAIGVRGRLPRVLGEHDGADVESARAEDVDESQHVLVVRDAEVAAHLGLLDVVGVDGDDDLHVVGEAFEHAEFGIRLEAGQHA